jgi:hypothetical protein
MNAYRQQRFAHGSHGSGPERGPAAQFVTAILCKASVLLHDPRSPKIYDEALT